jgi:hypothetical protein
MKTDTLIDILWQPVGEGAPFEAYAALDAARDEALLPFVSGRGAPHEYPGSEPSQRASTAGDARTRAETLPGAPFPGEGGRARSARHLLRARGGGD